MCIYLHPHTENPPFNHTRRTMHCTVLIAALLTAIASLREYSAQVYRPGRECARPPPVAGFDMNRFLGRWYVVQKSSTDVACLVYNITRSIATDDATAISSNSIRIELITRFTPAGMASSASNPMYKRTNAGRLWRTPGHQSASRMSVQLPMSEYSAEQ